MTHLRTSRISHASLFAENQLKSSLGDTTMTDTKKDSVNGWDKIPEVLQQMIIKLSSTKNVSNARIR